MILVAGGFVGGNVSFVLEVSDLLHAADLRPRFGAQYRIPVVYAGNKDGRERQKIVTADAVDPEAEVLFSRLRVIAGGATVRLCFITGGAFPENLDVVTRLDHPDVKRSLGTMVRSGEMVISGRERLLEETGVARYRSKGVTGAWRVNVPTLGWNVVSAVSALVAGMFEEESTDAFRVPAETCRTRKGGCGFPRLRSRRLPGDELLGPGGPRLAESDG